MATEIEYDPKAWETMPFRHSVIRAHTISFALWMVSLFYYDIVVYSAGGNSAGGSPDVRLILSVIYAVIVETMRYIIKIRSEVVPPKSMETTQTMMFAMSMLVYFASLYKMGAGAVTGAKEFSYYMMIGTSMLFLLLNGTMYSIDLDYCYKWNVWIDSKRPKND